MGTVVVTAPVVTPSVEPANGSGGRSKVKYCPHSFEITIIQLKTDSVRKGVKLFLGKITINGIASGGDKWAEHTTVWCQRQDGTCPQCGATDKMNPTPNQCAQVTCEVAWCFLHSGLKVTGKLRVAGLQL